MKALYRADDGTEVVLSYPSSVYPSSYIRMRRDDTPSGYLDFRYMGDGKCSSKIAHGPGHQSTTQCEAIGTHAEHYNYSYGFSFEWTDDDVDPRAGVAFAPTVL